MSNIPVSNIPLTGRPAGNGLTRPSPNSSMYNGGSFEIITPGSSSSSRTPVDFSYLNPLNNGPPGSLTDVTLEEALERIQDLIKENHELREYLKENNEMMKQQYQSLMEWKEKVTQSNVYNSKKFEETRKLVESLQKENADLKKTLEAQATNSEKLKEAETRNMHLEKSLSEKNDAIENLREQIQDLQLCGAGSGEKLETMLMIEKGDRILEGEGLSQTVRYQNLEQQVKQFRESNDQLLQDVENSQKLKEQFQKENASLCDQNLELSKKLEKVLSDLKSSNQEVKRLKQRMNELGITEGESFSQLGYSFVGGQTPARGDTALQLEEERMQMQSRRSRSSESDTSVSDVNIKMVGSSQDTLHLQKQLQDQDLLVQRLKTELQQKDQMVQQLKLQLENQNKEESYAYTTDLQSLRSQVVSLLNEVTELQNKNEAASKTIEKKNNRITELEQALSRSHDEMKQNKEDVTVIETLRLSINSYQEAVNAERREHQTTKKQLAELRQSFNQLVADYKQLNDELTKCKENQSKSHMENDTKRYLDEIGRLTAQILAAEETITYRDNQLRDLQRDNHGLKDAVQKLKDEAEKVPILKAQAEVWKVDFDAERAARERQHTEKEQLVQEMHNLQVQNQQLLDELETYSKGQFAEMQRRHAHAGGGTRQQMLQNYLQVGGAGQQGALRYPYPPQAYPQPTPANQIPAYQDNRQPEGQGQQQQRQPAGQHEEIEYQPLTCPKCDLQCPDVDTLQIHVLECIDQPDINN